MKYAALLLNGLAILLLGWGLYGVFQLTQARTPSMRPLTIELTPLPAALRTDQARVTEAFGAMAVGRHFHLGIFGQVHGASFSRT